MSEDVRCLKWEGHEPPCAPGPQPHLERLSVQGHLCGKPVMPPPEESLCGEEEALAAGSFDDETLEQGSPARLPEQLESWRRHVRGVGRSRQKAYAEALSLAMMQFVAWQDVFPVAYDAAMAEQGQPPINAREAQMLMFFGKGYQEFLREVHHIAKEGG